MARRKSSGLFGAVAAVGAALPWWLSLLLAAAAYGILHQVAGQQPAPATGPGKIGTAVAEQFTVTLASIGQYLIPLCLSLGAVVSLIKRQKGTRLARQAAQNPGAALMELPWAKFEQLVGEAFRQRGYTIAETRSGADGGIDLRVKKDGERFLVQCKHWRAQKVPVEVVRELYGVMAAEGAAGGFVVTSGIFTGPAMEFAKGRNIELIDGAKLSAMIASAQQSAKPEGVQNSPADAPTGAAVPACPQCGATMVRRVARRGANAGGAFWGCSKFPACRGMRSQD